MFGMAAWMEWNRREASRRRLEECFNLPSEEKIVDKLGEVALNCIHPVAVEQYKFTCKYCGELNNAGGMCLDCRKELYI